MSSQNNEDSINFSVIDRPQDAQPCLDISLPELLDHQPIQRRLPDDPPSLQKSVQHVFSRIKKGHLQGRSMVREEREAVGKESRQENGFLQALERMEKELSFQTESYNIYEQNGNFQTQVVHNNKSKTLSYLKTTTNKSTNPSANEETYTFNDYFGPLVIDFKRKDKSDHERSKKHRPDKLSKSNKSSKNGSQISSEPSEGVRAKGRRNTKSKSKEELPLGLRDKSSKYLLPCDFRKSKSKGNLGQRSISKSHSNLKISSQTDTYTSKVFTEYYGTDINFKNSTQGPKDKKPPLNTIKIKSREKSKSKNKLGLLSPRGKASQANVRK